ncbi:related to acetylhydrolase [Melanopsichium pennsylvanicum]|uniref:1-alkyl-2-acetylglycerophosphocholine esterase n=2 Tax=Melanopsichium pennsylvanicum TaxID=63383 RepID=A0AAJ4XG37_9BASI|nr:related to acetylhydrolase [Melanopsichium pennsylvanicum 4]SNX81441.1 related to acetylhydrolase [Melanopsichium pennsylvanicum]
MGLPPYTGPFKVGALDLEIPVRQPRSFCNNVVDPSVLNLPARKARRWAKKQNQEAKESRQGKQQEDAAKQKQQQSQASSSAQAAAKSGNNSTKASLSPTASTRATIVSDENDVHYDNMELHNDDQEEEEQTSSWSPWSSGSKQSTLHLETVLFTIYYPALQMTDAEEKRYPRAAWLGRPVHAGVGALLQYIGQYGVFAIPASPAVVTLVNARMHARVGPPLADPEELHRQAHPSSSDSDRAKTGNFGKRPPQFPVVIFSHGLAGNRLSYSQYCGELASQGIIVAAIEHRDGSGVSSIVRGEEAPDHAEGKALHMPRFIGHKGSGRMKASVPYFTFEKIGLQSFATDPDEREVNLRRDQIEMRHAEIEETFYVLSEINAGRGCEVAQRSTRNLGTKLAGHAAAVTNSRLPSNSLLRAERPLEDWVGKLDLDFPTLCGHSFGGATVIEMMRKPLNPYPIGMVLDPWVEPVRDPAKEQDKIKGTITKPLYVLNSESFTVWKEHFGKLKRICLDARKTSGRGWLLTLTGSKHTDFSDYPFLLPRMFRSTVGPKHTIEVFSRATYMQMGLSRQRYREQEDKPGYKLDRQGSLRDDAGPSAINVDQQRSSSTSTNCGDIVASPTTVFAESPVSSASAGLQSGLSGQCGKYEASTTMADPTSPATCTEEESAKPHEAVHAHAQSANAKNEAILSAFKYYSVIGSRKNAEVDEEDSRPQASPSDAIECSCAQLNQESKQDDAAAGQEARDIVAARQRQAMTANQQRDFITDVKYLQMIDADQDVQQVHRQLEGVAERFKNKSK